MSLIGIDFETKSEVDLIKHGRQKAEDAFSEYTDEGVEETEAVTTDGGDLE